MNEIQLPTDKKFGFFFSFLFALASIYSFIVNLHVAFLTFLILSVAFFVLASLKPELLHILNKAWMKFGFLIGTIVSPIVLAILFFCIISPFAILMKVFGRDELNLKVKEKESYWCIGSSVDQGSGTFDNQF